MNIASYELHWLQPALLGLLLAPAILLGLARALKPRLQTQHSNISKALYPLLLRGQPHTQWRQHLGLITVWTIFSIALAGPYLSEPTTQISDRSSANIVIILDISPSMSVEDIKPNRLQHARLQLNTFIRELKSTRIGLVSFSANAYIVLPLTHDQETLIHFVDIMAPELVTVPGSNLARALELAAEVLNEKTPGSTAPSPGLALLISDGEIHDNAAWKAVTKLTDKGHQLFTLGVGSLVGGPVPLPNGQLVRQQNQIITSQLRPEILQSLAQAGNGEYHAISPQAWQSLTKVINSLQQSQYQEQHQANISLALYPILIAVGLVMLFVLALRRPETLLLVLILPGFYSAQLEAAPWDEAVAYDALTQGNYAKALQRYQHIDGFIGRMGSGVSAYKLGQWSAAITSFQQAIELAPSNSKKSSAYYNLGNSLAQQKKLDDAKQAFEHALTLMPTHIGAAHNLSLIKAQQIALSGENNHPDSASALINNQKDAALNPLEKHVTDPTSSAAEQNNQTLSSPKIAQADTLQALDEWNKKQRNSSSESNSRQQLQIIQDDSAAMLHQRFGIEDVNTTGIVEEKPW